MGSLNWKDVTSYSRNEPEPRIPQSFETTAGKFKLVVTRHIHLPPTSWRIELGFYSFELDGNASAEAAKDHAETRLATELKYALTKLT